MKKNFYLFVFVMLLILQLILIMSCLVGSARETEVPSIDYANALLMLFVTSPISLMITISAVIMFARYKDKKENEEIKKYRQK